MKRTLGLLIVVFALLTSLVSAEIIRGGIDIDFVLIGNPGNAADIGGTPGLGAVDYYYRIGKYEVTNAQWNAFTAAAGAPTGNPSYAYDSSAYWTGAQQPINMVSWYEAAQFCNYLTSGDKSLGVYQLGTDGSITIDRAAALLAYGYGAVYVIPTEDEWYKAAYFKPDASGYSLYTNGQNAIPAADNGWNYSGGAYNSLWDVGTGAREQNGTEDMMGNAWEWNETLFYGSFRGVRGGSFGNITADYLGSSNWSYSNPNNEGNRIGFRVAVIVPEPASLTLLFLGGLVLWRKK